MKLLGDVLLFEIAYQKLLLEQHRSHIHFPELKKRKLEIPPLCGYKLIYNGYDTESGEFRTMLITTRDKYDDDYLFTRNENISI